MPNDKNGPMEMQAPFTEEEIKIRITGKQPSTGIDKIPAELIRLAPDKTFETIAEIFSEMAKTGEIPKEIELGILNPIPKLGKEKGSPENL